MTKLSNNPSAPITANGEYESHSSYRPADSLTLEVSGDRGGGTVQPGLVDVDGNFLSLAEPVSDPAKSTCWRIQLGASGKAAVKIAGAGGALSLKVTTTVIRG